jgi:hypothetical protein
MIADGVARSTLAWRVVRGLLLTMGAVVFCVGLVVVFAPEWDRLIPVEAAISILGSDYVVVAVLGLLAVGLSMLFVATRHVRGVDEANPPVVEGVQSAAYPGTEFDRAAGSGLVVRGGTPDDDFRPRLREAATRVTMRTDGCSRGVADRRVARGEWTDDPVAVRYLRDPDHADGVSTDDTDWTTSRDDRALRRTVDAILETRANGGGDTGEHNGTRGVQ